MWSLWSLVFKMNIIIIYYDYTSIIVKLLITLVQPNRLYAKLILDHLGEFFVEKFNASIFRSQFLSIKK